MRLFNKSLLVEMALICLLAAVLGFAWNHQLLYNAWTGKATATSPTRNAPVAQGGVPLPAGLMQVKEFYDRKEAVFVDARDGTAFAASHIIGALSLPLGETEVKLPQFKAKVPQTTLLVVYCNGYDCHDSMDLGKKLLLAGYRTVFVFEGGYPEWKDAGYPVEGGKP
ncbi:MAG: rhodanese domain-containing [Geobacteraceae bacterium]|nr:MAG: rhodanese domain-containing [Geobacteraceae bacterium]